jgi:hypothetical protein
VLQVALLAFHNSNCPADLRYVPPNFLGSLFCPQVSSTVLTTPPRPYHHNPSIAVHHQPTMDAATIRSVFVATLSPDANVRRNAELQLTQVWPETTAALRGVSYYSPCPPIPFLSPPACQPQPDCFGVCTQRYPHTTTQTQIHAPNICLLALWYGLSLTRRPSHRIGREVARLHRCYL